MGYLTFWIEINRDFVFVNRDSIDPTIFNGGLFILCNWGQFSVNGVADWMLISYGSISVVLVIATTNTVAMLVVLEDG
jgi:hypothetical protein